MKTVRRSVSIVLALLLVGYLLTGVVSVRPGERAVVRRFGRVLPDKPEPGLWIGLPWGMDRVDRIAVDRVQAVTVGYQEEETMDPVPPGQMLTGDHNLVNIQAIIHYKVRPEALDDYVTQADRVDALIARAAESVMGDFVAGRSVEDALLDGKTRMQPALKQGTLRRIEPYHLGVEILDARIERITPPEEVKPAFDAVSQAQTEIITRVNRAQQDAKTQLRTAQSRVYRMEQTTAAAVASVRLLATEDARRFSARLQKYQEGLKTNPDYLRQIWEEERGRIFAHLKANGQLGLLDSHLGKDGLDLTVTPLAPKSR